MTIGVAVPVRNHTAELWATLRDVRQLGLPMVVINDGDGPHLSARLRTCGTEVIEFATNRGVGAGITAALEWAVAARLDGIVTVDADGAHDLAAMNEVAAEGLAHPDQAVLTTRFGHLGELSIPVEKRAANSFARAIFEDATGFGLSDAAGGLRYLPRHLAGRRWSHGRFGWMYESLERILRERLAGEPVPIFVRYPDAGPHLTPLDELEQFVDFALARGRLSSGVRHELEVLLRRPAYTHVVATGETRWQFDGVPSRDAYLITELATAAGSASAGGSTAPDGDTLAIIPDGGRRWAAREHVRLQSAYELSFARIAELAAHASMKNLLVYCMSRDDLNRPAWQVEAVLRALQKALGSLSHRHAPILWGDVSALPSWFRKVVRDTNLRSGTLRDVRPMVLVVAYSSVWERAVRDREIRLQDLWFTPRLWQAVEACQPAVVLRTGGACTLSDMLPAQTARARLRVTPSLMNDTPLEWFLRSSCQPRLRFGT